MRRFESICERCHRWKWVQTVRRRGWPPEDLCDKCRRRRPPEHGGQLDLEGEGERRADPRTSDWGGF